MGVVFVCLLLFFFLWGGGVHVTISPGEKKAEETFLPWVPYYFMGGVGGGGDTHMTISPSSFRSCF